MFSCYFFLRLVGWLWYLTWKRNPDINSWSIGCKLHGYKFDMQIIWRRWGVIYWIFRLVAPASAWRSFIFTWLIFFYPLTSLMAYPSVYGRAIVSWCVFGGFSAAAFITLFFCCLFGFLLGSPPLFQWFLLLLDQHAIGRFN